MKTITIITEEEKEFLELIRNHPEKESQVREMLLSGMKEKN